MKKYEFGEQYTAVAYHIYITRPDVFVKGVSGSDREGKTVENVEALRIAHQVVRYLPRRLYEWYHGLNHLHIIDSRLEFLDGEPLDARIRYVHFDDNHISTLPVGFFKNAQNLELFSVERNRLTQVSTDVLTTMPKLRFVSFAGNRIRILPGDLFRGNIELECMNFENNGLVNVGRDLVKDLTKLEGAGFDGNVCINMHYKKGEDIVGLLTKDLTEHCGGQCTGNKDSLNKISELYDQLEQQIQSQPWCERVTKNSRWGSDESDSHESEEEGRMQKMGNSDKSSCPFAHYDPMQ